MAGDRIAAGSCPAAASQKNPARFSRPGAKRDLASYLIHT
jgi:hypothetical protein